MSPLALSIRFLQTQPDRRLLELARAGHERAFEALVQRYRRPLLSYCRRLSRSEASAEDALQQALLQAWIALSVGESEIKDVRPWLYRIVHNVAVSNLRRPVHDQVPEDQAGDQGGADQEVERRLAIRDALAGLASLPELQRQVMLSTALEGQSHDEVAAALGLSHGAVRGLIYRARATLRAAAAVLVPGPLISWAARQDIGAGGRSSALAEAIGGGGSAGVTGVLLKGGAIVATTGALAGAAGVTLNSHSHRLRTHRTFSSQLRPATAPLAINARASARPAAGARAVSVALRGTGHNLAGNGVRQGSHGPQAQHWQVVASSGQHRAASLRPTGSGSGSHSGSGSDPGSGSSSPGGSASHGGGPSSGSQTASGSSSSGPDGSSSPTSGGDSSGSSGKDGTSSGRGGDASAATASSSKSYSSSSDGGGDGASAGTPGESGSRSSGSDGSAGGRSPQTTTTPVAPLPGGN